MIPHAPPNKPSSRETQDKREQRHTTQHHHTQAHEAAQVRIINTQPEHVYALAKLQKIVFPTLSPEELFTPQKYLRHLELFPEGQFIAVVHQDGKEVVVGATSTFRTKFDFAHIQHTYIEKISDGWLTNHDPDGEWLYGVDMSVHPQYRGRRIARRFYDARKALVRQLHMRGELAGALLPGYELHSEHISIAQYALRVKQGKLHDPTLSVQLRNGFQIRGILYDHISDPRSENAAALIVRENPQYEPKLNPG